MAPAVSAEQHSVCQVLSTALAHAHALSPQIWSGDGEWYAASIIGVSAAGSFVVSFDEDGGTEEVIVNPHLAWIPHLL